MSGHGRLPFQSDLSQRRGKCEINIDLFDALIDGVQPLFFLFLVFAFQNDFFDLLFSSRSLQLQAAVGALNSMRSFKGRGISIFDLKITSHLSTISPLKVLFK